MCQGATRSQSWTLEINMKWPVSYSTSHRPCACCLTSAPSPCGCTLTRPLPLPLVHSFVCTCAHTQWFTPALSLAVACSFSHRPPQPYSRRDFKLMFGKHCGGISSTSGMSMNRWRSGAAHKGWEKEAQETRSTHGLTFPCSLSSHLAFLPLYFQSPYNVTLHKKKKKMNYCVTLFLLSHRTPPPPVIGNRWRRRLHSTENQ